MYITIDLKGQSMLLKEKLDTFFKQYPTSTYPSGTLLLAADEKPYFFYYIESGAVKMSFSSKAGQNLVLHIFFPKSFFSLLTLIDESVNKYNFISLTNTTIRKIPKTELISFIQADNEVSYDLNLRLLHGLSGLLKRITSVSLGDAKMQIAGLLVYFSSHFAESKPQSDDSTRISIKITHQEIADWLGLTRENVSIQMKNLEKEKFIEIDQRFVIILNLQRLKERYSPELL